MELLSSPQQQTLQRVVAELQSVSGLSALVLGGSHARGQARPDSDIDIGLYYRNGAPLAIDAVRAIATRLNDIPNPVVTGLGDWGPWVNGGAWLAIDTQKVDLLYRSLDTIDHTLADAKAGRFETHFEQQPPFGFFGPTLLGEIAIARPLWDPGNEIGSLKARVSPMPEALVSAVVQSRLWGVEFGLAAFAPKYVAAGNVFALAGCLTRFAYALDLTLFALNRVYLLNEKTALAEIGAFDLAPEMFEERLNAALASIGADAGTLSASMGAITALFEETKALAGQLYKPAWRL